MRIHILGICGTFMAGLAVLAKQAGHDVSGSDENVYPPMSTQLEEQGIELYQGYKSEHLASSPDLIIIGNAMKRGQAIVEYVLNQGMAYTSGPQWLAEHILPGRRVVAVAGTHGKTTTSSMLAWILEQAGLSPGFLIGGVPQNFGVSARIGEGDIFVIEADEYDSAFFDKRSKFIHYHPEVVILNNLEFDHADIFDNLAAIQKQFHHLIRTVPQKGLLILPKDDLALEAVLEQGCWSTVEHFSIDEQSPWQASLVNADGSAFDLRHQDKENASVRWDLIGRHNVNNGMAAVAASHHLGVALDVAAQALEKFVNVKRRMQVLGTRDGITIYDDFAHHPTAIKTTLEGLRQHVGSQRIIVALELASYTMRQGYHQKSLLDALQYADCILVLSVSTIDLQELFADSIQSVKVMDSVDSIVQYLGEEGVAGDHFVIMSNRDFGAIREELFTG